MAGDAHKFHIRLIRKLRVGTDLCANGFPGAAAHFEILLVDKDDEVRVASRDDGAFDLTVLELQAARFDGRHSHG